MQKVLKPVIIQIRLLIAHFGSGKLVVIYFTHLCTVQFIVILFIKNLSANMGA